MGLFDSLKNAAAATARQEASKAVSSAVNSAVNAATGANKSETFTFASIPGSVAELTALPEACLDSPFKSAALAVLILCNYEKNPDAVYEMLDFLNGPDDVNPYTKQFIKERLTGKYYIPFSFFAGATVDNGYAPTAPYKITVSSNPYSYPEENWAVMFVQSAGADSPRQIKLRKKPSTGQWFVNDIQCLGDIRIPKAADPWA